jgi:hypothetical protein
MVGIPRRKLSSSKDTQACVFCKKTKNETGLGSRDGRAHHLFKS